MSSFGGDRLNLNIKSSGWLVFNDNCNAHIKRVDVFTGGDGSGISSMLKITSKSPDSLVAEVAKPEELPTDIPYYNRGEPGVRIYFEPEGEDYYIVLTLAHHKGIVYHELKTEYLPLNENLPLDR